MNKPLLLLFSFLIIIKSGDCQLISSIAGTGTDGYNGDTIAAVSAELGSPVGVALDKQGNVYIAEYDNHRIRKITVSTGIITTIAGTGTAGYNGDGIPAIIARIGRATGVAIDDTGNVYIADGDNNRVRKVNYSTGYVSTIAGTGTGSYNGDGIQATAAELNRPSGVAFDASGNIYIADEFNYRIRKITISTGIISTIAGNGTAGYNADGIAATSAELNEPFGLALDAAGNVYIGDCLNNRIRKVTVGTGKISTIAGTGAAGYNGDGISAITAELNQPVAVALDSAGNVYIADSYNSSRIRKITVSSGYISTIAGTGTGGYNGDGIPAATAMLDFPYGVALDSVGNVYIADQVNNRLRKITYAVVKPVASFQANNTSLCANNCIDFTNLSSNATSYTWSFPGAVTISGTSAAPMNICYTAAGNYDVMLVASNANGSDTLTLTGYITVLAAPDAPTVALSHDTLYCSNDSTYTSYQWYADTALIPNATDTFLVISAGGNYNIEVTNLNGCSTATGINVTLTGIPPISMEDESGILLYPNPVRDQLMLYINLRSENISVVIYNMLGEMLFEDIIKSGDPSVLNIRDLSAGIYFLQIQNKEGNRISRFVKE